MNDTIDTSVNAQHQARLQRLEAADRKRITTNRRLRRLAVAALVASAFVLPAVATAIDVPHAFMAGDPVVAAELNENFEALGAAIDASVIREDTTIQIGPMQTCAAIQQALDDLTGQDIAGTATVTIELLPGTYACEASIVVQHRDGNRIHIRGAGNTTGDVELTFPGQFDGVIVGEGRTLGSLENLTLQGGGGGSGVLIDASATARLSTVVLTGFYYGLFAIRGASVYGESVLSTQNVGDGMLAWVGSSMQLQASDAVDNGGHGFVAVNGSQMHLTSCNAEGNAYNGYVAWLDATIESYGCTATDNEAGFRADQSSYISASDSISNDNTDHGYQVLFGAHLHISGPHVATGNGAGETNMPTNSPHPSNGATITQ